MKGWPRQADCALLQSRHGDSRQSLVGAFKGVIKLSNLMCVRVKGSLIRRACVWWSAKFVICDSCVEHYTTHDANLFAVFSKECYIILSITTLTHFHAIIHILSVNKHNNVKNPLLTSQLWQLPVRKPWTIDNPRAQNPNNFICLGVDTHPG